MTTKLLSREQWQKVKPPFYWVKITEKDWPDFQADVTNKWIETHCGRGWVYWNGSNTYAFESEGDQTMFVIWFKSDPFSEEYGSLK